MAAWLSWQEVQVAEIAALPVQQETIALWKALNGLKPRRPMVMIDQVCWHEMNVNDELTLRTQDEFCRKIERDLRRTLYAWKHMRADMVVEPVVTVPKAINGTGFGIGIKEERAVSDPTNEIVGHLYFDQLQTDDDLQKIHMPDARLDEAETTRPEAMAHEIFDGVLGVEMQGLAPTFNAWDWVVQWRGAENVLMDLAERPDFMHRLFERVTQAALSLCSIRRRNGDCWHSGRVASTAPAPIATSCLRPASTPRNRARRTCGRWAWRRSSRRSLRPCTKNSISTMPCASTSASASSTTAVVSRCI